MNYFDLFEIQFLAKNPIDQSYLDYLEDKYFELLASYANDQDMCAQINTGYQILRHELSKLEYLINFLKDNHINFDNIRLESNFLSECFDDLNILEQIITNNKISKHQAITNVNNLISDSDLEIKNKILDKYKQMYNEISHLTYKDINNLNFIDAYKNLSKLKFIFNILKF